MSQFTFRKTALAAALLTVGIAFGAHAQTYNTPPSNSPSATAPSTPAPSANPPATSDRAAKENNAAKLAHRDRKFIEKAAKDGMAEVELAKLAQQHATSDQVKQFAKRMEDDHTKANDELKKLADSKGLVLPTELDRSERREMDKLAKKGGADFDKDYMKHMVSDHKSDVKEFQSEAKSAKDADLKNFAASTLPTLEQHLDLAKSTEAAVKNEGKTKTAAVRQ
jgi:putative membrane protein